MHSLVLSDRIHSLSSPKHSKYKNAERRLTNRIYVPSDVIRDSLSEFKAAAIKALGDSNRRVRTDEQPYSQATK